MKAVTYIELDVPFCANIYGVSPCEGIYESECLVGSVITDDEGLITAYTASDDEGLISALDGYDDEGILPGGCECFNSVATCKDPDNYLAATRTIRFGYPDADCCHDVTYLPSIKSISFRPQKLSLGESLGTRASLSVTFQDHRDCETCGAGDPYWPTRGYNPFELGSFWGKFRARHKYLLGAEIRMITGIDGQSLEGMEHRTFVIEKVTGPSYDGQVTITAKDVLKLADDEKAQCPKISTGRLSAAITTSATSATLTPSGVGDEEYPSSGHVTLAGKEICAFTRSGDALTITRAQFGTDAIAHEQNDSVQLCKEFFATGGVGLDPADIIYDLLVNYTTVPSSWISLSDWQTLTEMYIGRLYYSLIAKPTAVRKLLIEIIEQTGIVLYTDDVNRQVKLDIVRKFAAPDVTIDEDVIAQGSFTVQDLPDKRLSQVWTYYGQRNPLEGVDEVTNYTAAVSLVDEAAETLYGQPAIKQIFSRFIPRNNRSAASDICYRMLSRFRDVPRQVTFDLWRYGDIRLELSSRASATAWPLQLPTGEQAAIPVQVTELNPGDAWLSVTAQEVSWTDYDDAPDQGLIVIIDADIKNINLRTEYDKSYSTPVSGDAVTCLIESGVVVGSASTSEFALTVGLWPSGVTLLIINNGFVVGAGGNGGGRSGDRDGSDGGPALYCRSACTIQNNGTIGGGGGGGAASAQGGGGGGAGAVAGSGGDGSIADGANGTLTSGGNGPRGAGDGGDLGEDGGDSISVYGGAAGIAIDGYSYISFSVTGTIAGATQN